MLGRSPGDDWLAAEVGRLLRLFRHAAGAGECVVSVLERPPDPERAGRVRVPFPLPERKVPTDAHLGAAEGAAARAGQWTSWVIAGSIAGAAILGALGVCYWRYRRYRRYT
jgi:hypothetical protein